MDIFAHGLWGAAGARLVNRKLSAEKKTKPLHIGWAVFWNLAPDLFSFGIFFAVSFLAHGLGRPSFIDDTGPNPRLVPAYVYSLYNWTHSLIIFAAAFFIVWLIRGKPIIEMLGWGLHIAIDIPTHTSSFFPTPFLWPISNLHASVISWADPRFLIFNYIAIAATYIALAITKKQKQ
jgi:hypothetical protein